MENEVVSRLAKIEEKMENLTKMMKELVEKHDETRSDISDIHQYVPFVGWLDSSRRSLSSIFSLASIAERSLPTSSSDEKCLTHQIENKTEL